MKKLFYGGTVLTMAEPLYAEALLYEDDRILAVGSLSELSAQAPDAEKIDLKGHCLMPAFIDPHSHFTQLANAQMQISLDGADTVEEMRRRIQAYIAEAKPEKGCWLSARDYDNNVFPDAKHPGLEEINTLAPGYRLVIYHKSGHMGLFNSEGLEALGIKDDTPAPDGGMYGHTDGRLNGYMEENAFFMAMKRIPLPGLDDFMKAYRKAQDIYAANGIAYVQEGMTAAEMLPLFDELLNRDILKLDLSLYCGIGVEKQANEMLKKHPGSRVCVGGLKIFLDGSPQGRTAWMRQPYEGGDGRYCAYGTMTDQQVIDSFLYAGNNNLQLIAHCNGDAAAEQFLRCLEIAEKTCPGLKELRPVIIHAQLMGRDQMQRAKDLGATISFFVAHVRHWGDTHIKNFGMERASHISAAATAGKLGIPYTFHQDTPVLPPNMIETISIAANRISAKGVTLGEDERVSTLDALKAVTVNAAWQYSQENVRGSLEKGKVSDFVILSEDPLRLRREELESLKVLALIKEGVRY